MVINFSCKISEAKVFRNSVMTIEFEINFLLPSLVNNLQDKNKCFIWGGPWERRHSDSFCEYSRKQADWV